MFKIDDIVACMREMAPEDIAEPWDNCGLLVDSGIKVTNCVIVCLDVTGAVVEEAVKSQAHLIICHHPLIFSPIKRIDSESRQGALLRAVIRNDIAVYAAHTNVDKTYGGLNDLLAGIIGLDTEPYGFETKNIDEPFGQSGYYRVGELPQGYSVDEFNCYISSRLRLNELIVSSHAQPLDKRIKKVLVMSGSYSLDARQAAATGADALVCGEIRHHEALELTAMGIHIVQAGHHGSERFFISLVQKWINDKYPALTIMGVGFSDLPTEVYRA